MKNSVSVIRLVGRDAITGGLFWTLVLCAVCVSFMAFMMPARNGRMLSHDAALILCVFFWAWPLIGLFVRYVIAASRLTKYMPVSGRRLSTAPTRGGYAMQYAYEWKGQVHHGGVLTTQRFSDAHPTVTVLVDPSRPERSTIKELYC